MLICGLPRVICRFFKSSVGNIQINEKMMKIGKNVHLDQVSHNNTKNIKIAKVPLLSKF